MCKGREFTTGGKCGYYKFLLLTKFRIMCFNLSLSSLYILLELNALNKLSKKVLKCSIHNSKTYYCTLSKLYNEVFKLVRNILDEFSLLKRLLLSQKAGVKCAY